MNDAVFAICWSAAAYPIMLFFDTHTQTYVQLRVEVRMKSAAIYLTPLEHSRGLGDLLKGPTDM